MSRQKNTKAKNQDTALLQHARPETYVTLELDNGNTATFRIIHWTPTKVFNRLPEYGSILGVPLIMYSTAEEFAGKDFEEKIGLSLIQLFSGLEQRVFSEFVKDILDEVYTKSQDLELNDMSVKNNFDTLFAKHSYLILELAAKVLEVNYGPFFKRGFGKLLTQFKNIETLVKK